MDIRKEMSQNIFLTGGCTLIPGFAERLELELTKLCPPHLKPKVGKPNFFLNSLRDAYLSI
jgi:actin-related protein